MKANLPKREPETLTAWEMKGIYHQIIQKAKGRQDIDPRRRSTLCERAHPHWDRPEQDT